ncbi:MAG: DUF342 domain-containing protein [Deltaproteobacteria bacterium]|nr:DUF342 domain-containing protein [Deltaproteobacteria bacterium]
MKIAKKKKSVQSLDNAYLDAVLPQDKPTPPPPPLAEEASGQADPVWQDKKLLVAPDSMSVTLKIGGGSGISTYQLNHALTELGVKYGIDWAKLAEAEQISKFGGVAEIVVAKGTPPGSKRVVKFIAVKKVQVDSEISWLVDGVQIDFARLTVLYKQKDLARLDQDTPRVKAVLPGEVLVRLEENSGAKKGRDIFGVEVGPKEDLLPEIGEYVHLNDKAGTIESRIFGYLFIDANTISVLPPLWVTEDRLQAYFINLPQLGQSKLPTNAHLRNLLIISRVVEQCKRKKVIDIICQKLAAGKRLRRAVLIARAIPPKPGKDAAISLYFDDEKRAGTPRGDGSLDLRERNVVASIQEGTKIAVKTKAGKGIDGCDIFGGKIKAADGRELNILVDNGIRVEKGENSITYFAQKSGNVKFKNNRLIIADIYNISGDVDYNTGNIDINTDLLVKGSVLPGFRVRTRGSATFEGSIDNGATLFIEGDMVVNKGIMGEDTRIIVLGDLHSPFIQDAEVIVRGETIIGSYLYNSMLRANGGISILKVQGRKSGRAVGGVTCSSTSINLSTAGNNSNLHTVLAIQADPEISCQLTKVQETRQLCKQNISKITRALPFDTFEPAIIKNNLAKLPPSRRLDIIKLLTNLNKLIKQQKLLKAKQQEIKAEIDRALEAAKIRITSGIFLGCEIQIGDKKLLLNEDLGPAIFQLENGRIVH